MHARARVSSSLTLAPPSLQQSCAVAADRGAARFAVARWPLAAGRPAERRLGALSKARNDAERRCATSGAAAVLLFCPPPATQRCGLQNERLLGPVVLFGEGCVTNGKCVLPLRDAARFEPLVRAFVACCHSRQRAQVDVFAVKLPRDSFARCFTTYDGLWHAFWVRAVRAAAVSLTPCVQLAAAPSNSMSVLQLADKERVSLSDATAVAALIAALLRVPVTAIAASERAAFDAKWLGRSDKKQQ